jgi:hypothetical protein
MFDLAANCSVVPDEVQTDAGVAGAGTLLSFIITNFISILLASIIILLGLRSSTSAPVCRKLLQGLSDQQIVLGIGIQSLALAKMKSMVPYHFFIIWLLSHLSTATNLATLLALVNDFRRDWVLRWIRQFFMLINMLLGILSGIFILQAVMKNLEPRLPIACVWEVEEQCLAQYRRHHRRHRRPARCFHIRNLVPAQQGQSLVAQVCASLRPGYTCSYGRWSHSARCYGEPGFRTSASVFESRGAEREIVELWAAASAASTYYAPYQHR